MGGALTQIVHTLVAETAKSIAFAVHEVCCSNDAFYKQWPKSRVFVARNWRYFIGDARTALAAMLAEAHDSTPEHPTYKYPQHTRDAVFEALVAEGEMKAPPPLDLAQLRARAGFEPIDFGKGHRQRLDA